MNWYLKSKWLSTFSTTVRLLICHFILFCNFADKMLYLSYLKLSYIYLKNNDRRFPSNVGYLANLHFTSSIEKKVEKRTNIFRLRGTYFYYGWFNYYLVNCEVFMMVYLVNVSQIKTGVICIVRNLVTLKPYSFIPVSWTLNFEALRWCMMSNFMEICLEFIWRQVMI